jgi:probable addiction module antidote protein
MEKITFDDWDLADGLETKEDIRTHLETALSENDMVFLLEIISALARSKGMAQISKELGITQESLFTEFSPQENPSFAAVAGLLDVLGFRLSIRQKTAA